MALHTTVPVVLFGRFTTIAGEDKFETVPIAVSEYSEIELTVWRGKLEDAGHTFILELQESMDQETWSNIGAVSPTSAGQVSLSADISRSYLRAVAELQAPGAFPILAIWVAGWLKKRQK